MQERKPLTPQREAFVREYIVDLDATNAAIRAGYSKVSAHRLGLRLKRELAEEIDIEKRKRNERVQRTADDVVSLLWDMMNYKLDDYFNISGTGEITAKRFDELPEGASRLISGFKFKKHKLKKNEKDEEFLHISDIEYKMPNKDKIIELLLRHHGLLTDNVNVNPLKDKSDKELDDRIAALERKNKEEDDTKLKLVCQH